MRFHSLLSRLIGVLGLIVIGCAIVRALGGSQSGGLPTWLNYQGRLTQPTGAAVADGSYQAQFRIFDSPTNGNQLWSEGSTVAVKQGVFSATLGRVTPFPTDLFTRRLWLEPEIEGRVLTPRQELGAVAFAMTAASALSMPQGSIHTGMIADGAVTDAKLAPGVAIPIGGVIPWWGDSGSVPTGWKLCDGTSIVDPQSTLNGLASPDLRNRFIQGVTGNVRPNAPMGGMDHVNLAHTHTVNPHTHTVTGSTSEAVGGSGAFAAGSLSPDGHHIHAVNIVSSSASPGTSSALGDIPLLPPFVGLVYIMRVR